MTEDKNSTYLFAPQAWNKELDGSTRTQSLPVVSLNPSIPQ